MYGCGDSSTEAATYSKSNFVLAVDSRRTRPADSARRHSIFDSGQHRMRKANRQNMKSFLGSPLGRAFGIALPHSGQARPNKRAAALRWALWNFYFEGIANFREPARDVGSHSGRRTAV